MPDFKNHISGEEGRELLLYQWSEKQWQWYIVRYARERGWWDWHAYDSRRSNPGLPDLILIRERVVWIEVKTQRGRVSKTQKDVRDRLLRAHQEYYLWRPYHWRQVREVLY